MAKKYRCNILVTGEDFAEGKVWLTDEEYKTVRRVLDPGNWADAYQSGKCFNLPCITCPELDGDKAVKKANKPKEPVWSDFCDSEDIGSGVMASVLQKAVAM